MMMAILYKVYPTIFFFFFFDMLLIFKKSAENVNSSSAAIVSFDLESNVTFVTFEGLLDHAMAERVTRVVIRFLRDNNCSFVVNDLSRVKSMHTKFLQMNEIRTGLKYGVEKYAIVVSEQRYKKLRIFELGRRIGDFEVRIFKSLVKANRWVLDVVTLEPNVL
ncbi:hypothetical protein [Chryseolinea lacunae]|uniref:DUF4783 domain-containing protein n=1 Tax=Chryseolinea lacunae TaxID=2801331 RepID=A0ABS1L220_9BACT|nr:hypothetical protein [Chryseolinea lacunae]MBL0745754.1 hypothetical protein [Chryseolinea lacunae]